MRLLLILLLAAAGGCVTSVETVKTPRQQPAVQRQTVTDKRVVIASSLEHAIRVVGVKETTAPQGFLRIQVDVQNLTDTPKQFSYRIDWFDGNAQPLPMADSPSFPWMLLSHETSFLATTAPTPAAKDFRVTFLGPSD